MLIFLGKKLMIEVEKIGRERGCTFSTVDTMDWEALILPLFLSIF